MHPNTRRAGWGAKILKTVLTKIPTLKIKHKNHSISLSRRFLEHVGMQKVENVWKKENNPNVITINNSSNNITSIIRKLQRPAWLNSTLSINEILTDSYSLVPIQPNNIIYYKTNKNGKVTVFRTRNSILAESQYNRLHNPLRIPNVRNYRTNPHRYKQRISALNIEG